MPTSLRGRILAALIGVGLSPILGALVVNAVAPRQSGHVDVSSLLYLSAGVLVILLSLALAHSISRPVQKVAAAARRMATGDLTTRVEVSSGGEAEALSLAFNSMAQELCAKVQALQESRRRVVTKEERVRRDLAQQIHGSVQSKLLLTLHRLRELENSDCPEPAEIANVRRELEELLDGEIRPLSHQLYPSILRLGLLPALRSLRDRMESAITVDLRVDEVLKSLEETHRDLIPEPVRLAAYRVIEEALVNVIKHAGVKQAVLEVSLLSDRKLCVSVRDEGRGFNADKAAQGIGVTSMRDYTEAIGGHCTVRSIPGLGTEVEVIFPL